MSEPADMEARELSVEVMAVRWRLPDGDFAVLAGVTDDGEEVVVTGPLAHVHEGETIGVGGGWRRHAKHGWQFHAERVTIAEPVSEAALIAYLASVKHVGPRGARFLLERHGPEAVLAEIDRDPDGRLREVPGIGPARIRAAVRSWEEQGALRAVRLFLESHGVPAAVAARIYRAFGAGSIELLQSDPYAITELDGIGFATADALAQALGTPPDSPGRLDAGVVHALREAERDGHCHLPRPELEERARRMLDADVERPHRRARRPRAHRPRGRTRRRRRDAPRRAAPRRQVPTSSPTAEPALRLSDPERPTDGEFVPTDAQWQAVTRVLEHRLSILTGGPGTGKTGSMRVLVDLLSAQQRTARLCAPTGKAARRLAETTGADATTIHRLLEWQPGEGFTRDAGNPIEGTRRADRRRGVDAVRVARGRPAGRRRPPHPRAARRRRRPARARRPRPRARGPDRLGRRARRPG